MSSTISEAILKNAEFSLYQQKWESRSSVRSRPEKWIDFSLDGYFFPSDKQPLLLHNDVQALGESIKQEILLQSFFKYLNDIIHLEVIGNSKDKMIKFAQ